MILTPLHAPQPARARVFVLPHAGGSLPAYRALAAGLGDVELVGVQLPGRGSRFTDPAVEDVPTLAEEIAEQIAEQVAGAEPGSPADLPYGILGHSFGALVGFETCRALRRAGVERRPRHLWVSAFPAPDRIPARRRLSELDDQALLGELDEAFGAIPPEVLDHPELMELVAGYVRSDYRAMERYAYADERPLDVDLTVLSGRDDLPHSGDPQDWRRHTTGAFVTRVFDGGHFYLHDPETSGAVGAAMAAGLLPGSEGPPDEPSGRPSHKPSMQGTTS